MSRRARRFAGLLGPLVALALAAAACTPSASSGSGAEPVDDAWRGAELVDVRTGEPFTIDALRGKLVAIEPMAIWCSNCRTQQREAVTALAAVASDDLVFVSLDVDPNEEAGTLAAYADDQGFGWTFAVASRDIARSLAAAFGDQVLSPPSTPMILIAPDGSVIETHVGIRRAAELEALFREHLP